MRLLLKFPYCLVAKQVKRLIAICGEYWIPTTINYISLALSNDNRDTPDRCILQMQNNINAHNHVRHVMRT
ncbi:hypothetical protein GQX74_014411 [Glossina fuscipes]|nr:hypothetical protein GQX74_014411 [Glossina fuscipes]